MLRRLLLLSRPFQPRPQTLIESSTTYAQVLSSAPTSGLSRIPFFRPHAAPLLSSIRLFSGGSSGSGEGDGGGTWKLTPDAEEQDPFFFGNDDAGGARDVAAAASGSGENENAAPFDEPKARDLFDDIDQLVASEKVPVDTWGTGGEVSEPWKLGGEGSDEKSDIFGDLSLGPEPGLHDVSGPVADDFTAGDDLTEDGDNAIMEEKAQLEVKEQELMKTVKGPNRAFGDLISASGITEDMIDSLILLKDVRNVPGLPPLSEIEDKAIAKMNEASSRAEIERQKQEEIAKARVRTVDEKGRAYGTGRRKCSIARVWIQPGDGKFVVNDKLFDAYFPILDHRAELLRPFTVTKTLGTWDIKCTVKGGGVSGQVGAIRLGISRALQNWEPGFRPYLKAAGYLTRDSRVVERKKPGKAKARKSFQWVKR